ncbi:MAG TPA: ROK family protein [Stellaceae bacterium]|nr:ROK family protein [Stellaceae bacterium]
MRSDETRRRGAGDARRTGLRTLGIDIGGSGIKAGVLGGDGRMLTKRVRVPTPHPCPPEVLLKLVAELVAPLSPFQRISIGFPGVIRSGHVLTAPNLGTPQWRGFPLEARISRLFGRPARLMNDAEVQGLGIIRGRGLEVVLTLGTGVGSAIFDRGRPAPHLELAHHPLHKGNTYDEYLGNEARRAHGRKKWNRRLRKTIDVVRTLLNFDVLYLGGGNAGHIDFDLPDDVRIASNNTGITGGIHLWDDEVWDAISGAPWRRASR